MNNRQWEIEEVSQDKLKEEVGVKEDSGWYHGLTVYSQLKIYIWKDMNKEAKRQTLMHELLHCYIGEYCSFQDMNYTEDIVCNISANSHDIIDKIVNDYFKEVK